MNNDDQVFSEIAENIEGERIIVSITQQADEFMVNYTVDGTDDLDLAIAATVKGVFAMCLDAMGIWSTKDEDLDDEPLE